MTKVELHIIADSAAELQQAVLDLATTPQPQPGPTPVTPEPKPTLPPAAPAEKPPVQEPAPAAAKKRGRGKRDGGNGEAIETAATEPIEAAVTLDAVKAAFTAYQDKFGLDAVMEDGPQILARVYGDDTTRIRDIPVDDAAKLAETVSQVQRAISSNEFNRQVAEGATL